MNVHESEKVAGVLENMGYTLCGEEEIADVLNMAEQLEFYYGANKKKKIREEKMKRTLELLNEVK